MRFLLLLTIWLGSWAHGLAALEVKNPRWGFGGKPVLGTFNLLSVEVRNPDGRAFEGMLTLRQNGGEGAVDYQQPIFLAPGTSRWVQFTPYLAGYKPEFSLSWGDGRDQSRPLEEGSDDRAAGPPAVVILADPEAVRAARLPLFPENLFPVTVAATDGLHAVVLDHAPRFQPPQSEAFADWVRLGGIVHLVPGPGGAFPEFAGNLAGLNVAETQGRWGAGLIVKHRSPVAELSETELAKAGFASPAETSDGLKGDAGSSGSQYHEGASTDAVFFRTLGGVTKPKLAWWLIYLLTTAYIIIIGPVFFFLRKRDYRFLLAAFLGTVALFAWVFMVVGRRGYGEKQICHSLAVARVLGGGRYDVTHWSHAFATSGDDYHLAYPGASHLYAAPSLESDKVRGRILLGKEARFDVSIPLFSFRNFLHRGVMTGEDFAAQLVSLDPARPDGWKKSFKMSFRGNIPGQFVRAAVDIDGTLYRLSVSGQDLVMDEERGSDGGPLGEGGGGGYYGRYDYYGSAEEALRALSWESPMLARRFGADPQKTPQFFGRAARRDTVRLYLYTRGSTAFRMAGDDFASGQNFILYVQDFPLPPPATKS